MRLVVKFPTRGRYVRFFKVLDRYRNLESGQHDVRYVITCDLDDIEMNHPDVREKLDSYDRLEYRFGHSKTKIQAINADMDLAGDAWDALLLASDDMTPVVKGWDDRIATEIKGEDAVWFFDGTVDAICTLSIMSRKLYLEQGYIYHPAYKSVFCDNEWTDVAKPRFIREVIIRHDWVGGNPDALLRRNEAFFKEDQKTYKRRKNARFPK